jgi:hypothetical protein
MILYQREVTSYRYLVYPMQPLQQALQTTPREQQAPFTKTERLTGAVSVFHVSRNQVAVPLSTRDVG